MSKNTNLSFLTDYITADITNGRIGINNASPTVAFDVVGATKITGVLTLTSTISNGTYAYTLPSATGTLALTSDLSSYLPLAGGTLTGALGGTSATFSNLITVSGFGNSTFSAGGTGYNKLTIRNTTAGTGNGSQLSIGTNADADQFYVQSFATTFTTSGMNIAGGAVVNGEGPGGLSIAATQSNIGFYTNGAGAANLRMTIASAGNVGIGTSSPAAILHVQTGTNADGIYLSKSTANKQAIFISGDDTIGAYIAGGTTPSNISSGGDTSGRLILQGGNVGFQFQTSTSSVNTTQSWTERMRITSGGEVLVGTTTTDVNTVGVQLRPTGLGIFVRSGASCLQLNRTTSDGIIASFRTSDVERGSISIAGSVTSYNTSSDYRLKEDLKEIKGLEKISAIKVYDFKWKGEESRMDGVLAHELQEILPYAVHGVKDEERMQGVDYSKIVPVLVKAIQELSAKVTLLENK